MTVGSFSSSYPGARCAGAPALFAIAAGDAAVRLEELSDGEASEQAPLAHPPTRPYPPPATTPVHTHT